MKPLNETLRILSLGFSSILLCMTLLLSLSLGYLHQAYENIDEVVHLHHEKSGLITKMLSVARERQMNVQYLLLLTDPFKRDEEWLKFKYAAMDFIHARDQLMQLDLSEDEKALLTKQDHYAQLAVSSTERIAELAFNEQIEAATKLLLEQTEPLQRQVFSQLERLKAVQENAAEQAVIEVESHYKMVLRTMLILSAGIILLCVLIAIAMVQRTAQMAHALDQARQDAEKASLAKTQFMANMSHELRTPLNAIMGYSEVLKETAEDEDLPEMLEDLDRIHGAGRHLLEAVTDVLDMSLLETGDMPLELSQFNLTQLCASIDQQQRGKLERNNNTFEVSCTNELTHLKADHLKLERILVNLIDNAARFTSQGKVQLKAERQEDWIEISVIDTGMGISPEKQQSIFEAFSQADNSSTRKHEGLGLGLAISQHFAQMMQGEILLHSEVGKGSHFTLRLPLKTT